MIVPIFNKRQQREPAPRTKRLAKIKSQYGLSEKQLLGMYEAQNNKCAICSFDLRSVKATIDHDHKTGRVRGLLCWQCNVGLGNFADDPTRLEKAAAYVRLPQHNSRLLPK